MTGRKSLYGHLGALAIAAVAAAVVYQLPEKKGKRQVVIVDQKLDALTGLDLTGADKSMHLAPRSGGGFTIEVQLAKKSKAGTGAKSAQQDATENAAAQVRRYRASQEFVKELERLLPLRAERELGRLDAEQLEQYGLGGEQKLLRLRFDQQQVEFELGGQTYGGATLYLRRKSDGVVYLVSTSLTRVLDFRPPRYLERRLVEPGRRDVDELVVSDAIGQKHRTLVKTGKPGKERWHPTDDPQTTNNIYGTWVGQLFLLGAEEYLERPPQPEPKQLARVVFRKDGKTLDELTLAATEKPPVEGKQPAGKLQKIYYARSRFTGQWVRLRAVALGTFFKDLPNILGQ